MNDPIIALKSGAKTKKRMNKSWPGVDKGSAEHGVRVLADRLRTRLNFSSENLSVADPAYVAWMDLMGAGHTMATSIQKASNAIARLHLALDHACQDHQFSGERLPINDGVFVISRDKSEIMSVVRSTIVMLAGHFIARPSQQDRFLIRGSIAYGPVYSGLQLAACLSKTRREKGGEECLSRVLFGPPIIQAFQYEKMAPPYGISIHESARAFAPAGVRPFQMKLWLWWQANDNGTFPKKTPENLTSMKTILVKELSDYFKWLSSTRSFHEISDEKIAELNKMATHYFKGPAIDMSPKKT